MNPAIHVEALVKRFGDFIAVNGISFQVPRGTIFGFLGPNGAGKTTTIRMLLGLIVPTSGQIQVLGHSIPREVQAMRQRTGYMSQKFSLYRDLTVSENLDFYGTIYGLRGARLRQRQARILELTGLEAQRATVVAELPGGWKQRLALGCAILHEPELLFLDEPTAGVDPASRRSFWDLLYALAEEGTTIFVTTHYMDEAERCRELALIMDGRLVAQGTPATIKRTAMRGEVLEIECDAPAQALPLLQASDLCHEVALYGARLHAIVSSAAASQVPLRSLLTQHGLQVYSLEPILPSMEDVFISLVRSTIKAQQEEKP